jgi:SAM-dependent methyltransferase
MCGLFRSCRFPDKVDSTQESDVHGNTILLFKKYAQPYFQPHARVVEVGPDGPPSTLQQTVGDNSIRWESVGIDDDSSAPMVTYTALSEYVYPIESSTVDIVVAANVMEHIRKPWVWIKELARICKSGGYVITINPVSWPYHEYPVDCWRAYPDGMEALYQDAQLEVVLSRCESLEDAHLRRHIPGRSLGSIYAEDGWKTRAFTKVMEMLRLPVERPYDTVTIGRK